MEMRSLLIAFTAMVVLMAGCTTVTEPDMTEPEITPLPVRSLTKAETDIVDASSEFGYNLFRQVNNSDKDASIFISPLSVSMALGMTMNGASGATLDSMRRTLTFADLSESDINEAYRTLIDLLTRVDPRVRFQIANSIWYRDDFNVEPSFVSTNKEYFNAEVTGLNFGAPSASGTINDWVNKKTYGKIEKIVADKISTDVVMYLINAIYFKGTWSQKFDPKKTSDKPFTLNDGSTKQVKAMYAQGNYSHNYNSDAEVIDLPYGDSLFSMTVLLPHIGTNINDFVANLTSEKVRTWVDALRQENNMEIYLPKFKLEYEKSLNDMLKMMGMEVAFSGSADFSRINKTAPLAISEVKHKTFVEVNEEGTEAAAATSVEIVTRMGPPTMMVNRPFVFLIRERTSGAILFMGKIMEPKS